jgi:hypothetical protein
MLAILAPDFLGSGVAGTIDADVAAADAFWADAPKQLSGPPPEFGVSTFNRRGNMSEKRYGPLPTAWAL